jgi:hypothetical protein
MVFFLKESLTFEKLNIMENLILSESSIFSLQVIRKWAKFIAVFMFVMIGLMVLAGFFMGFAMSALSTMSVKQPMPFPSFFFTIIYLVMALIYFFPVLYLYRFSQHLGNALMMGSSEELSASFQFLSKHYHFVGVLMIISLILFGLMIFVAVIAGIFGLTAMNPAGQFSMLF